MIAAMESSPVKTKMSVMELARPPDPVKDAVVTGAVTVISVQHGADGGCGTPVITEHGNNVKYYQACNGVIQEQSRTVIKSEFINCSPLPGGSCLPHEEDDNESGSDGEVSKIDFTGVNLRMKKKRVVECEDSQDGFEEPERPMSWEGELSDTEMGMITGEKQELEETSMEGVQVCGIGTSVLHHTMNANHNHLDDCSAPPPLNFTDNIVLNDGMSPKQFIQSNNSANALSSNPVVNELPLLVDKLLSNGYNTTPSQSPIMQQRHHHHIKHTHQAVPPTPSPDSAIHSVYSYSSPTQSPVTSRHGSSHGLPSSGFSSPYTPSLSRNNSDASQYGGSQHSSCYSYSSVSMSPTQYSPTHSPIQSRHMHNITNFPSPVIQSRCTGSPLHVMAGGVMYGSVTMPRSGIISLAGAGEELLQQDGASTEITDEREGANTVLDDKMSSLAADLIQHSALAAPPGISRQQLINSPCPICGDKISGFHYGIFSCESCKGFFKRTVQNRKNYVCLRGSSCPVTIATRKKCPACRFEKCLKMGMKLEAIREDRTRGGRSTYQCSYTLPTSLVASPNCDNSNHKLFAPSGDPQVKLEAPDVGAIASSSGGMSTTPANNNDKLSVPQLLQEIMDVEHLWHNNEAEANKNSVNGTDIPINNNCTNGGSSNTCVNNSNNCNGSISVLGATTNSSGESSSSSPSNNNPDFLSNLCNIADHRLYRLVKWCKSLPLFKNISIDDQISLLINAWCELLLFSCCFRSVSTPGEIRVSLGKCINLNQARELGLGPCIERMLNFTDHLRRLKVDKYEYVAMKVIVLLTSDAGDLKEPEKVRASQEKALQALQHYTLSHYPDIPSKFGELLLRIPELQRTCQVGKEMLSTKNKEGEGPSFNLLMELLRGDH